MEPRLDPVAVGILPALELPEGPTRGRKSDSLSDGKSRPDDFVRDPPTLIRTPLMPHAIDDTARSLHQWGDQGALAPARPLLVDHPDEDGKGAREDH